MKIAIEGCSHGELDAIYASILLAENKKNFKADVLLLCGDFQAIRNKSDLQCLAVPDKFRQLGEFHKYYSGEKVAPVLTIVIGGNHEASNYMWELFHGGWLAPNIYYLGSAGCVEVGGLRIAGVSGIYKDYDYPRGRFERMPYSKSDIRSVYHTRLYDILRLKQLSSLPQIVLSHDWPNLIERAGDFKSLLMKKKFFTDEVNTGTLGSPPLLELMKVLKPKYWFSAHLHVKFSCVWRFEEMEKKEKELGWGKDGWGEKGKFTGNQKGAQGKGKEREVESAAEEKDINPEALDINDDDMMDDEEPQYQHGNEDENKENPDEIEIDFEEEEEEEVEGGSKGNGISIDEKKEHSAENIRNTKTLNEPSSNEPQSQNPASTAAQTKPTSTNEDRSSSPATHFLALSKCLPQQDFLQFLDVPSPYDEHVASSSSTSSPSFLGAKIPLPSSNPSERRFPPLRFSHRWLAITRALHPFLSLEKTQHPPLPEHGDPRLEDMIKEQEIWVQENLMKNSKVNENQNETSEVDIDTHPLAIGSVQGFVKTAPSPHEPGGNENNPPPWYTNPQTESFCAFLQVPNLINPSPHQGLPQPQPQGAPPQGSFSLPPPNNQNGFRLGSLLSADGSAPSAAPSQPQQAPAPPTAPAKDREAEEIARIKESAERRRKEREEMKLKKQGGMAAET